MQCRSITYQPHSNECGPRTLFALTALALHPDSTPNLLLSFMHPNFAQILRTWVAATIVTGQCFLPTWQSTYPSSTPRATSVPAYLFPWKSSTRDHKHKTKRRTKRTQLKINKPQIPPNTTSSRVLQTMTEPTTNATIKPTSGTKGPSKGIQLTIYDALKIQQPQSPTEYDDVWGHFPPSIDDDNILQILFANPRGIKLSSNILETEYSLGRCNSFGVGALCVAEANIYWDNHRALGKFYGMLRKVWKHSKVSKSHTRDVFISENQPGGQQPWCTISGHPVL
jgi:hypothetical protein